MKVVIIGGVAGGAPAAIRLKREMNDIEVEIFEKSSKISFANCGLPYGISGVSRIEDLAPSDFSKMESAGIKVNVMHEVTSINEEKKFVTVKDLKANKISKVKYDKLIVATGARVANFPIKGIEKEKSSFGLRTFDDMKIIINNVEAGKKALIVGGGFIGVEMAEALQSRGMIVHLVEPQARLAGFDYDFSSFLEEKLRKNNITLHLGHGIEEVKPLTKKFVVNNEEFGYDIIIKTGITANTEIFKGTSVVLGDRGIVETNKYMQTKNKDIYAVGDIALTPNIVTNSKTYMPFARNAKTQGRTAADHIAGIKGSIQYASTGAFGFEVYGEEFAGVGVTEAQAKNMDIQHRIVMATVNGNAGYVPSGKLVLKMLWNLKNNKLIGLQAYGKNAAKAVDSFSVAITAGYKLKDLREQSFVYQPHLSTALNPLNTLAQIALNEIRLGFTSECPVAILKEKTDNMIIDVRDNDQHKEKGHLKGAINIPTDDLSIEKVGLPLNKSIVVHCNTGFGSSIAARKLINLGYTNVRSAYGGNALYQLMIKK